MLNQEENDPVSDMNTTGEFNSEILYREVPLSSTIYNDQISISSALTGRRGFYDSLDSLLNIDYMNILLIILYCVLNIHHASVL